MPDIALKLTLAVVSTVVLALASAWALHFLGPGQVLRWAKQVRLLVGGGAGLRRLRIRTPIYLPAAAATILGPLQITSDGLTWRYNRDGYLGRRVRAYCPDDDIPLEGRDALGNVGTLGQSVIGVGATYFGTPFCLRCRKEFPITESASMEEAFTLAEGLLDRERRRRSTP